MWHCHNQCEVLTSAELRYSVCQILHTFGSCSRSLFSAGASSPIGSSTTASRQMAWRRSRPPIFPSCTEHLNVAIMYMMQACMLITIVTGTVGRLLHHELPSKNKAYMGHHADDSVTGMWVRAPPQPALQAASCSPQRLRGRHRMWSTAEVPEGAPLLHRCFPPESLMPTLVQKPASAGWGQQTLG